MDLDRVLSKYADPADFDQLGEELAVVDAHFTSAREQHPMRRWEYALALRALQTWRTGKDYRVPMRVADVGGAGSPFGMMLHDVLREFPTVIDPDAPTSGQRVADYLTTTREDYAFTGPLLHEVVFCLSVLEHIPPTDLDQFLYHLSCLVAPGGLLFLTMDAVDRAPHGDTFHFHWMRQGIFDRVAWLELQHTCLTAYHYALLGEFATTYPGPQVYDYSFASLALVKRS